MANNINNTSLASALDASTQTSSTAKTTKNQEIGQEQFLQLLVTQLKNQDPMDPMKNEDFAVNLAQFSSLEQLVQMNKKMGATNTDFSSLASYLGTEVVIDSDAVNVNAGTAGTLSVELLHAASSLKVDILDSAGQVLQTLDYGAVAAGKHSLELAGLTVANGDYKFKVNATSTQGTQLNVPTGVGGIVTGFIPGADPSLLIGAREVKPADIKEVKLPSQAA